MSQRQLRAALLALMLDLGTSSATLADTGNTLGDELRAFTTEITPQCASVKEQLESFNVKADPLTGYNLKDAVQSLCHCLPAQVETFMSTLSAEDLAREVSNEEFLARFNPVVIDKCAAEQMRAMYGEQCPSRFKKAGKNARQYCACMKEVVSQYSEAETAAIAAAASDYLPLAAEAEKDGEPVPPRPPILEKYYQADKACKAMDRP